MVGSVKDQMTGEKLSESKVMRYLKQTAEGLAYLHSRKPKPIIHRNIKCKPFDLNVPLTLNSLRPTSKRLNIFR